MQGTKEHDPDQLGKIAGPSPHDGRNSSPVVGYRDGKPLSDVETFEAIDAVLNQPLPRARGRRRFLTSLGNSIQGGNEAALNQGQYPSLFKKLVRRIFFH